MAISGPSGSGKTYTALRVALGLGKKIAVVDSEFGSASKYADVFEFDCNDISGNKHPNEYVKAIKEAEAEGYDVLVIDSITHAWEETKNVVDKVAAAQKTQNTYTAWKDGTKVWDSLKTAINASKIHVIVTMRAKTEYSLEERNGKKVPVKIGMAPEVRDGTEYEFDVVLEMTQNHFGTVGKTRCSALDGYCEEKPGEQLGATLLKWLSDGEKEEPKQQPQPPPSDDETKKVKFIDAVNTLVNTHQQAGADELADALKRYNVQSLAAINPADRATLYNAMLAKLEPKN